ncbi:MAG: endonuclease V [Deltaproteobacteria bacterium]|nr:endonuclease V [Deltaproteobacteria bacterium]
MRPVLDHPWNLRVPEAREVQEKLAPRVVFRPFRKRRYLVAGTDVSFDDERGLAVAGVVVVSVPSHETVAEAWAEQRLTFPYVPGFLSFREIPALLSAFEKVESQVDCIMADGQGIAHPRRFGLASHLGMVLGVPTLGCAKSRLIGEHGEPGFKKGSTAPLLIGEETVGAVVRTRDGVSPVYVSAGHKIDLEGAVRVTIECAVTRIPEPTRRAHTLVTGVKRGSARALPAEANRRSPTRPRA